MDFGGMLVYVAMMCFTPGPNNLMAMYLGASCGLKGARRFITASALSFLTKMLLCGGLNLALASAVPALVPYLKWAGAAYMLYLAWKMLATGFKARPPEAEEGPRGESTYRSGILLQLLNIKSWVMGLSVFSIYVIPYTRALRDIIPIALICTALMLAATLCWAVFGRGLQRVYYGYIKPFSIGMALSLVWCAVTAVL